MPPFSPWPTLPQNARAHLIGICGAGMKALAEYLLDSGWIVSGCDGDPDPTALQSLCGRGVSVWKGHACAHLDERPDLLIYSPAVNADNLERVAARQRGIPQLSYVNLLSRLTASQYAVAIAGTHGKSTTTAMLGQILQTAGRSASVLCGGESIPSGRSGWAGQEPLLIVEACEFRQHFLELHPQIGCLLGIEPDHFDCYPTLTDAERAYRNFARNVLHPDDKNSSSPVPDGSPHRLIVRSDCTATRRVIQGLSGQITTFSLHDPTADWRAVQQRQIDGKFHFHLQHAGTVSQEVQLAVPGAHNAQNALAAAACAGELGVPLEKIAQGLTSFAGLRRRFELRGKWRGALLVDDYAHHPTEIQATLMTARQVFPGKKLICLFQPHQLSRTAALLSEFAAALSLADKAYLLPVYAARENTGARQDQLSREILEQMTIPASFLPALDQVWRTVQTDANRDAVLLTLGAGNLSRVHYDDIERTEQPGPSE